MLRIETLKEISDFAVTTVVKNDRENYGAIITVIDHPANQTGQEAIFSGP
jgi:hypothetical protein